MRIEMRWAKTFTRRGDGSIAQKECGDTVYFTLQFRTYLGEGRDGDDVFERWTDWRDVTHVEDVG